MHLRIHLPYESNPTGIFGAFHDLINDKLLQNNGQTTEPHLVM